MRSIPRQIAGLIDPRRPVRLATLGWIVLGVLVLDQATKLAAVTWLAERPPVELIPNLLNLRFATNTGAAFSMFTGRTWLLALFSLVISVAIAVWAVRLRPEERGLRPALGLILGGAIGNLIDRVRLGHVIDFIDAHWFWRAHWPTFNVADSAVCVGVGLLIAASLLHPAPRPAPRGSERPSRQDSS